MIEILPLRACHVGRVAQLHIENLQTMFSGRAGCELLRHYYHTVAKEMGGCGYVAIDQNEVLGYVCGIWDAHELRRNLLLDHGFFLALWGTLQVLGRPKLIFDFLTRFRSSDSANASFAGSRPLYELRPIVVTSKMRRCGLGQQLVKRLIDDARSRGYDSICLYTEQDNETAQRFYERLGFREVGRLTRNSGGYLLYEMNLAGNGHS